MILSSRKFWTVLAALAAVRLVLMLSVPVFEPSEARYAAISANMARTGDFTVPRFTHELEYQSFDGKPPLVFQAGGLVLRALGVNAANTGSKYALQFGVRAFPFASAALVLWILFGVVRRRCDEATARLAVVVCATCAAFFAAAGIAMTDMTLACCTAGALLLYGEAERISWKARFGIAALLGAGFITKGPIALVLFGFPVFVDALVNRHWLKFLDWRWFAVAPVFLAIAAPWFVLMEREVPGSTVYFFYNENFLRFVKHDYGDKYGAGREAFRGVSVLWAFVATLPWALVPLWKLVRSLLGKSPNSRITESTNRRIDESTNSDWKSFWLLSVLAITGFWCLTSRVLLYYLFPVIPLFAAWLAERGDRERLVRCVMPAAAVTLVAIVGALVGGTLFSEKMRGDRTPVDIFSNHYAYEFYHGTPTDAEFRQLRSRRAEAEKWQKLWNEATPEQREAWKRACENAKGGTK